MTPALQTEYIRGVIDDSLTDFRLSVHRDVHNMYGHGISNRELMCNSIS